MRRFIPEAEPLADWNGGKQSGVRNLRFLNDRIAADESVRDSIPEAKLQQLIATYDGGIFYVDEQLGRLLGHLDESGLSENTIVVVVADHGEAFLDRSYFLHKELHRALLRVPLVVHDPRRASGGRRIATPVSLTDVTPTLLAACGIEVPAGMDGQLLPVVDREAPVRPFPLYSRIEKKGVYDGLGWQEGDWKLLTHRDRRSEAYVTELFDTATDPQERSPIVDQPSRVSEMRARMNAWFDSALQAGRDVDMDPETVESLRALGYLK